MKKIIIKYKFETKFAKNDKFATKLNSKIVRVTKKMYEERKAVSQRAHISH